MRMGGRIALRRALLLVALACCAGNFLLPLSPVKAPKSKGSIGTKPTTKQRPTITRKLATGMVATPVAAPLLVRFARALWRLPRRLVLMVPGRLPNWWKAAGLTSNTIGRVVFLGSNVAYFAAGYRLLMAATPNPLAWLMLSCGGVSVAYHSMQCGHGCDSEEAARWCLIDTSVQTATRARRSGGRPCAQRL